MIKDNSDEMIPCETCNGTGFIKEKKDALHPWEKVLTDCGTIPLKNTTINHKILTDKGWKKVLEILETN
jgi:DnaJ-class molecular chaperone